VTGLPLLVSVPVVEAVARLLRVALLAAFLPPAEFGLAMALAAVVTVAELAGDAGQDRFVMLREGEAARRDMAAMHSLLLARGALLAAALFLLAAPLARLVQAADAVGAFQWAAGVLLLRAPLHLEVFRRQREGAFGAAALVALVGQGAGLAGTALGAGVWGDHRAALLGLACDALGWTVASHALARTPWRLGRRGTGAALRFSAPLMLSGAGIAAISQADRLLVGQLFGTEALGLYALVTALALAPAAMLARTAGAPMLARALRGGGVAAGFALAALLCGGVAAAALALLPVAFGAAYAAGGALAALAVLLAMLRVLRGAPTTLLLARGATGRIAVASLATGWGLAAGWALALAWPEPAAVLAGLVAGEAAALALMWGYAPSRSSRATMRGAARPSP
jgi:O-antigen/teichoic acid export membrane protein